MNSYRSTDIPLTASYHTMANAREHSDTHLIPLLTNSNEAFSVTDIAGKEGRKGGGAGGETCMWYSPAYFRRLR